MRTRVSALLALFRLPRRRGRARTARRPWVEALEERSLPDGGLAHLFASGAAPGPFVAGLYENLLGRAADASGVAWWQAQVAAGLTPQQTAAAFLASPEYLARLGGADWLTGLYGSALGRPADAAGWAYWHGRLAAGASPAAVALGFLTGPEFPAAVSASLAAPAAAVAAPAAPAPTPAGPRDLVVRLAPGDAALPAVEAAARAAGAALQATDLPGVYRATADPAGIDRLARTLTGLDGVLSAEPSQQMTLQTVPNDPAYPDLWGMNGTHGIQAPLAWDATTGTTGVTVAVIDTGIDYDHIDLYENIWLNQGEIPDSWLGPDLLTPVQRSQVRHTDDDGLITFRDLNHADNAGLVGDANGDGRITAGDLLRPILQGGWEDGSDADLNGKADDLVGWDWVHDNNKPWDDDGHGTHVAGTVGAVGDNGHGVVGVNWNAQLMALKFISGVTGSGDDLGASSAIAYAAANGARVSNNSYGGGPSTLISNAIVAAQAQGHVVVAAAGNSNRDVDAPGATKLYPAAYDHPNIISVAATTIGGNRAQFSNWGALSVDLGAPGLDILSTFPGDTYGTISGTSMASPHVAGVVALVLGQHPEWTYSQVVARVLDNAAPLPALDGLTVTGGLVDASHAVMDPDLSWQGGGLTDPPATADTTSTFTVERTYAIDAVAVAGPFTVAWYASLDAVAGNADDVYAGSETFSAAADLAVGLHPGTSPALRVSRPGTHYLVGVVDDLRQRNESDETNNASFAAGQVTVSGRADVVVDNSDPGYAESGPGWASSGLGGHRATSRYHTAGTGANEAAWQATNLPPGDYDVSVTWAAGANRATNASYQVYDGDTLLRTVTVNQKNVPSGEAVNGRPFQKLGTFTGVGSTLRVVLSDGADGVVSADAVRLVELPPPTIDLGWSGGVGDPPAAATTQTSFTVSRTYTIADGNPAGTAEAFTIAWYASTDGTLANATLLARESVAAGQGPGTYGGSSPALRVRDPGTYYILAVLDDGDSVREVSEADNVGVSSAAVTVTGTSVLPSGLIDHGSGGYSESGSGWAGSNLGGHGGSSRYHAKGTGLNAATWQATDLPNGTYEVHVSWLASANRAMNAAYKVYDGDTLLKTVTVSQKSAPVGPAIDGTKFRSLGAFAVTSGTLRVVLSDAADGIVSADAVRYFQAPAAAAVVDDGGPGYAESGTGWASSGLGGYAGDSRYRPKGNGQNTATWEAAGLVVGSYEVEVTWAASANRATSASYQVYDGDALLATVTVNQQKGPVGALIDGRKFQSLGAFAVSSGRLRVVLSDGASGVVSADAVVTAVL
jgi:subtilisin family serine protease